MTQSSSRVTWVTGDPLWNDALLAVGSCQNQIYFQLRCFNVFDNVISQVNGYGMTCFSSFLPLYEPHVSASPLPLSGIHTIPDIHNFVEAPLVTLGVNGV